MDPNLVLIFTPIEHPEPQIRSAGFELTDPYVEQCWNHILGPTATLLLRRLPQMWAKDVPAPIRRDDLGRWLGVGAGDGRNSRLSRALDRIVTHRFGRWQDVDHSSLAVYSHVPALSLDQFDRAPTPARRAHDHLLGAHASRLASRYQNPVWSPPDIPSPPSVSLGL